jgi:CubicO group peptidase (beta-lactamase class C family)
MLLRHGYVISEGWWAPYSAEKPHSLFSLSKSFTSTAIGLAVEEDLLTVDDFVISYFPEDTPKEVSENLAKLRIKHLLSMSTGHDVDTTEHVVTKENGNWVQGFLELPIEHEPGTFFVYNTGATYILSAIIQKITGKTLIEYLAPQLFEPLGIEGASWESCPRGINIGGFGLSIKTEDIAKLGQLYLQKGM